MTRLALLAIAALPLAACATQQQQRGYGDYDDDYYGQPIQAGPEMDFRYAARGVNWTMTIDQNRMQLTTDQGLAATDNLLDFTPNRDTGDIYRGEDMLVTIMQGNCTIGGGGQTYPHQVMVQLGGQTFRGCGQPSIVPPSPNRY